MLVEKQLSVLKDSFRSVEKNISYDVNIPGEYYGQEVQLAAITIHDAKFHLFAGNCVSNLQHV